MVNKWFALQAMIEDERRRRAGRAPACSTPPSPLANPNRVRAVLGTFAPATSLGFHRRDGAGYRLLADKVLELDRTQPAGRRPPAHRLGRWRRFDPARQALMRAELERVAGTEGLSRDSYEIASKSLA